jgi:cadmium resistance protein CadD (predicted permease)
MEPFIGLAGLVAVAFASTNLDNLLLLVSWQMGGSSGSGRLFAGYGLGMIGVLTLAVLLGLVGYLFPLEYLALLGVVPIALGVKVLFDEWRSRGGEAVAAASGATMIAVAATQLSNGVDTILVFAPLLADSQVVFDVEIAVLFLLMIPVWFGLSRMIGRQAGRLQAIQRWGRWLAPLVMIGVGIYILTDTATDLNPG